MLGAEPTIRVGILDRCRVMRGRIDGSCLVAGRPVSGFFKSQPVDGLVALFDSSGREIAKGREIRCTQEAGATFTLFDVAVGSRFHWEHKEEQTFEGNLILLAGEGGAVTAVNEVGLEAYLSSVVPSEMNPEGPPEFLKAQAVTSRSWLAAMLERAARKEVPPASGEIDGEGETVRWYGREAHNLFDVCADDHCQRYRGVAKVIPVRAAAAVEETRGLFLVHEGEVSDARFHKACGGLTEKYENVWEGRAVPYLSSVSDARHPFSPVVSEDDAERWILSNPDAYCNVTDEDVLRRVLPSSDLETGRFFRWEVTYTREELEAILSKKSGIDFGTLRALTPLERGPSGRIVRLRIEGSKRSWVVGKELEIRRWLSESHLLSSAFVVGLERDGAGTPAKFILRGAGWGHGVGLCQVGAAVMALKGHKAEEILRHYFRGAELKKLY